VSDTRERWRRERRTKNSIDALLRFPHQFDVGEGEGMAAVEVFQKRVGESPYSCFPISSSSSAAASSIFSPHLMSACTSSIRYIYQ
jgi:hypothetical protein